MRFLLLFTFLAFSNAFQCEHFRDIYHESNCCQEDGLLNCLHETPSCDTQGLDSNQICVDANNKRLIVAPKINRVLEKMVLRLDGTSVESQSGTITTTDTTTATVLQSGANTYSSIGSVSYVPPTGTKQVLIRFQTWTSSTANSGNVGYDTKFSIANVNIDASKARSYYYANYYVMGSFEREWTITIDPDAPATNTFADSRVTSWTTTKEIKMLAKYQLSNGVVNANQQYWSTNSASYLYKPTFTITAIGEGY